MNKKLINIICILLVVMFVFTGCNSIYESRVNTGEMYLKLSIPFKTVSKINDVEVKMSYGLSIPFTNVGRYINKTFKLQLWVIFYLEGVETPQKILIYSQEAFPDDLFVNVKYSVGTKIIMDSSLTATVNFSDYEFAKGDLELILSDPNITDGYLSPSANVSLLFYNKGDKIVFDKGTAK